MADRCNRSANGFQAERQLELEFDLPAGEQARRDRIRAIRHHFFCLIERLPEATPRLSVSATRAVKGFLKRLYDAKIVDWNGVGTFRQSDLARRWFLSDRTVRDHLAKAKAEGWIATAISTDAAAIPRTTVEFLWPNLAAASGSTALPEQPAMAAEQPAMAAEQPAMAAGYSYCLQASASTSTFLAAGEWPAAAAEIFSIAPQLALGCLDMARRSGVSAAEAIAIARHWQAVGGWGVGALYRRLQRAVPGLAADAGWPDRRGVAAAVQPPADVARRRSAEAIRCEVLRRFRPSAAGLSIEEVMAERERHVAAALEQAGLAELLASRGA